MVDEKYNIDVERTLFNWYYGGEDFSPYFVTGALARGIENNMEVLVPVEDFIGLEELILSAENLKVGDTISLKEDMPIKFIHLPVKDSGEYYVPIFTSSKEADKAFAGDKVCQSLKDLVELLPKWEKCLGFVLNIEENSLIMDREYLEIIKQHEQQSQISFLKGSVLDLHVDAIVNAANTSLLGGGGIDGAIHKAAGPELLKACKKINGCNVGEVKVTSAYNIKNADGILHTVGPIYTGKSSDAEDLAKCYWNALNTAVEMGFHSIAFPSISTGAYGYPLEEAAHISFSTVLDWMIKNEEERMDVYMCCYRQEEYEAYMKLISQ